MQKQPRILVIDCDTSFIKTTKVAFRGSFEVFYASVEEEGLKKAKKENPDIVVLGFLEPRGTSRQLALRLAEENATARIPLLLVDVHPDDYPHKGWRWSDGFSHNIKGYMWRPVDALELKKTVEGVLQRARSDVMNLTEVAEQTEEMVKRIDQLKRLLGSDTES